MISLVVSDLHAHAWTRFATTLPDGTNSRFAVLLDVLDQVETYIKKYQPDSLIVLGDVTHKRYFVQFSVYNKMMAKLDGLRRAVRSGRGIMVVGNHDYESVGVHSLSPFQYAGWTVIDEPTWLMEGLFVPWMPDNKVTETFKNLPRITAEPIHHENAFLHYALDGHILDTEYALPSPLRLDDLHLFKKIFMGHVHSPAIESDGRVAYVGAPMHFDFGDVGPRFCWLTDGEKTIQPLPLTSPSFVTTKYPKVPVPSEPGYVRVLGVPHDRLLDVKEHAVASGWLDALTVEEEIPAEAIQVLSSNVMLDADVMKNFVARQYPDLDDETRAKILQFGLDCLNAERA